MVKHAIIVLTIVLLTVFAQAQEPTLVPFETVDGSIAPNETQPWVYNAVSGEVISIVVESTSTLDPTLRLTQGTEVLITNDDYAYPSTRDALLQAITIPRTGQYSVEVSGFDGTAGTYSLTVLRGYAGRGTLTTPLPTWTSQSDNLIAESTSDTLSLVLEGEGRTGTASASGAERLTDYYSAVDVEIVNAGNGWAAGMTIRQQNASNYYLLAVNERGQWRMTRVENGTETVLRNWIAHPSITPGETTFNLSVLANAGGFDAFYNHNLLGQVIDEAFSDGIIGVGVQTPTRPDSDMLATFSNLQVSTPIEAQPDQLLAGDATTTRQALERRGVIVPGGSLALNVPQSTLQSNNAGVTTLSLGRGTTYQQFVMASTVTISPLAEGPLGCGLVFRQAGEDNYYLAYLDQEGAFGLSQRTGDVFQPGIFGEDPTLIEAQHRLLIIGFDAILYYYIDGNLVGTLEAAAVEGGIGNAVVNFEPTSTSCTFEDTWLWSLD